MGLVSPYDGYVKYWGVKILVAQGSQHTSVLVSCFWYAFFMSEKKCCLFITSVFKKKIQNAEVLLSLSDFRRIKGEKNVVVSYLLIAVFPPESV